MTITTSNAEELPRVLAALAADGVDLSAITVSGVECTEAILDEARRMCSACGVEATIALAPADDAPRRRGRKS